MKKFFGYDKSDIWLCQSRWGLNPEFGDELIFAYPGTDYFRWIDETIEIILYDEML
jgi:hypothetical protein